MEYIDKREVKQCYHECYFFSDSMDGMYCGHPYFKDKISYENMIITQENSRGRVPDKCPLLKENIDYIIKVSIK